MYTGSEKPSLRDSIKYYYYYYYYYYYCYYYISFPLISKAQQIVYMVFEFCLQDGSLMLLLHPVAVYYIQGTENSWKCVHTYKVSFSDP